MGDQRYEKLSDGSCAFFNEWFCRAYRIAYGIVGTNFARETYDSFGWMADDMNHSTSDKVFVPFNEAVKRLPDGEEIHTFRQNSLALIGADWERSEIIALLRVHDGRIEETGPVAMRMHHGLAINDGSALFIETK